MRNTVPSPSKGSGLGTRFWCVCEEVLGDRPNRLSLLTHMRLEAFASVRYGRQEGEFRFGTGNLNVGNDVFSLKPSLFDLGLALRVAI